MRMHENVVVMLENVVVVHEKVVMLDFFLKLKENWACTDS